MTMEKKIGWSGDAFQIRTVDGQPAFFMPGRDTSFSKKKILQDLSSIPIVNIKNEGLIFKGTYHIYAGDSSERLLATIRRRMTLRISAEIQFTNHDGSQRVFDLDVDFPCKEAIITDRLNRMPVGRIIRRVENQNEWIFGQQTYIVTAAPNVDLAFIICICVALDEIRHEARG